MFLYCVYNAENMNDDDDDDDDGDYDGADDDDYVWDGIMYVRTKYYLKLFNKLNTYFNFNRYLLI